MPRLSSSMRGRLAATALTATLAATVAPAGASSTPGSLANRIGSTRGKEHTLGSAIGADSSRINRYQSQIDDLQAHLDGIQSSLDFERRQLQSLQIKLRAARSHLIKLRIAFATDRKVLARQLVGTYESSPPGLIDVVIEARGFADLLERVDHLKSIRHRNVETTAQVRVERRAVSAQERRLSDLEAVHERVTRGVLIQHDEIVRLRLGIVAKQLVFVRARSRKSSQLSALRSHRQALQDQLSAIQAREAAAPAASLSGVTLAPGGPGSFALHGGAVGIFPAPGTNYSFGDEPKLAARLDQLGKALQLHLIGLSGYRTPQHSVEVGGFANDPHTRGQASDTPGIEGVGEGTLNQFGLTRPFPGAAEADHIQLVGSI